MLRLTCDLPNDFLTVVIGMWGWRGDVCRTEVFRIYAVMADCSLYVRVFGS